MAISLLNRLRNLQKFIRDEGLGSTLLALPSSKVLLLSDGRAQAAREEVIFTQILTETEIVDVSRDLFQSGFFNQAVEEAFKALDRYIRTKSGLSRQSGASLMNNAFSPNNPILCWSDRSTVSEEDEHKGYHMMYSGGFLGIRNPVSHEINWIADHSTALDAIMLAQHLLRKAKLAKRKA